MFGWLPWRRKQRERKIAAPGSTEPEAKASSSNARRELTAGDVIHGAYSIQKVIRGGMGAVYIVQEPGNPELIVLKATAEDVAEQDRQLFIREAQTWIDCGHHPNIVRAFWIKALQEGVFVAAEYIAPDPTNRNTVDDYVRTRAISPALAVKWTAEFCYGLGYATQRGVICHRDIKPSNLMVDATGVLKITDFGIALPSRSRLVKSAFPEAPTKPLAATALGVGTPIYMSPEQISLVRDIDVRSDIYSFGATLFEMCTGAPPFIASSLDDLRRMHLSAPVPATHTFLDPLIARCMAKRPAERYAHPYQLLDDLRIIASRVGLPVPEEGSVDEFGSHYSIAVSLLQFGNLEDAFKHIAICVKMCPDHFAGWNQMGLILKEMGHYGEAIAAIKRSLDLKRDNDRAWSNLGLALEAAGNLDAAIAAHREAMRLGPDNPVNITNAASCLTALEKWPEVVELCQSAVLRFPKKASLWSLGGQALLFAKRTHEGQEWLRRAIAVEPARKAQIVDLARRFGVTL